MALDIKRYIRRVAMVTYDGTNAQEIADFATNPGTEGTILSEEDGILVINFGGSEWGATYTLAIGDRLIVNDSMDSIGTPVTAADAVEQWVLSPDE